MSNLYNTMVDKKNASKRRHDENFFKVRVSKKFEEKVREICAASFDNSLVRTSDAAMQLLIETNGGSEVEALRKLVEKQSKEIAALKHSLSIHELNDESSQRTIQHLQNLLLEVEEREQERQRQKEEDELNAGVINEAIAKEREITQKRLAPIDEVVERPLSAKDEAYSLEVDQIIEDIKP